MYHAVVLLGVQASGGKGGKRQVKTGGRHLQHFTQIDQDYSKVIIVTVDSGTTSKKKLKKI